MMGYHAKRSLEEKNDERDKQLIKDKQELTYAVTKKKLEARVIKITYPHLAWPFPFDILSSSEDSHSSL